MSNELDPKRVAARVASVVCALCLLGIAFGARGEEAAAKAPQACEDGPARARFYDINDEITAALKKGDTAGAVRLANEYLSLAAGFRDDWNYGNAIHEANTALGLVALREKNRPLAVEYLQKAGATPGSPQLNSFGPDLSLANALLAAGERQAVVAYLRAIASFWEFGRGGISIMIERVENGDVVRLENNDFVEATPEAERPRVSANEMCQAGYEMSRLGYAEQALEAFKLCIDSPELSPKARRASYIARAWAYGQRRMLKEALADQEAAFKLAPASNEELINYSATLRAMGRTRESLAPLLEAEKRDQEAGKVSLMTQYHLGLTYHALGRYQDAVDALTRGLSTDGRDLMSWFQRGLAWEALGKKAEARGDFKKVAELVAASGKAAAWEKAVPGLKTKLSQYGLR